MMKRDFSLSELHNCCRPRKDALLPDRELDTNLHEKSAYVFQRALGIVPEILSVLQMTMSANIVPRSLLFSAM